MKIRIIIEDSDGTTYRVKTKSKTYVDSELEDLSIDSLTDTRFMEIIRFALERNCRVSIEEKSDEDSFSEGTMS